MLRLARYFLRTLLACLAKMLISAPNACVAFGLLRPAAFPWPHFYITTAVVIIKPGRTFPRTFCAGSRRTANGTTVSAQPPSFLPGDMFRTRRAHDDPSSARPGDPPLLGLPRPRRGRPGAWMPGWVPAAYLLEGPARGSEQVLDGAVQRPGQLEGRGHAAGED